MRPVEKVSEVCQTIHAAVLNLKDKNRGVPCSFRGNGVFVITGGGLGNNPRGYAKLLDRQYIEEIEVPASDVSPKPKDCERDGKIVLLYPTLALLYAIISHTGRKRS